MILAVLASAGCAASGERDRALGLVSVDVQDAALESVVADVERQTGIRISAPAGKRVTIRAERTPFHAFFLQLCRAADLDYRIVHELFDDVRWEMTGRWDRDPAWTVVEGAAIFFETERFSNGYRISRRSFDAPRVSIGGRIEEIRTESGAVLEIERCGRCGDSNVFVRCPVQKALRIRFEGRRVWWTEETVEVRDRTFDGCEVDVEYPDITITSPTSRDQASFPTAMLRGTLKDGEVLPWSQSFDIVSDIPAVTKSWCMCPDGPKPVTKDGSEVTARFYKSDAYRRVKREEFRSIELVLRKRRAEPLSLEAEIRPR